MAASKAANGPVVTKISNGIIFTHKGNRFVSPYFIDPENKLKECSRCNITKPFFDFYKSVKNGGIRSECKDCCRKQNSDRNYGEIYSNYKDRKQFSIVKYKYGLSKEQYLNLLEEADGKCMCCGSEEKLFIDHCHSTAQVRGLLCRGCNSSLGYLKEDETKMQALINYVRKHKNDK